MLFLKLFKCVRRINSTWWQCRRRRGPEPWFQKLVFLGANISGQGRRTATLWGSGRFLFRKPSIRSRFRLRDSSNVVETRKKCILDGQRRVDSWEWGWWENRVRLCWCPERAALAAAPCPAAQANPSLMCVCVWVRESSAFCRSLLSLQKRTISRQAQKKTTKKKNQKKTKKKTKKNQKKNPKSHLYNQHDKSYNRPQCNTTPLWPFEKSKTCYLAIFCSIFGLRTSFGCSFGSALHFPLFFFFLLFFFFFLLLFLCCMCLCVVIVGMYVCVCVVWGVSFSSVFVFACRRSKTSALARCCSSPPPLSPPPPPPPPSSLCAAAPRTRPRSAPRPSRYSTQHTNNNNYNYNQWCMLCHFVSFLGKHNNNNNNNTPMMHLVSHCLFFRWAQPHKNTPMMHVVSHNLFFRWAQTHMSTHLFCLFASLSFYHLLFI